MPKRFAGFHSGIVSPILNLLFMLYCWFSAARLVPSHGKTTPGGTGVWFVVLGFLLLASCTVVTTTDIFRKLCPSRQRPGPLPAAFVAPLSRSFGFSRREEEVCVLLMRGYGNRRIADELFISVSTVKSHVYSIFRKADVRSRAELLFLCRGLARDGFWPASCRFVPSMIEDRPESDRV